MATDLERAIFKTVAWFSLFDYPVTSFEIWKWLIEPVERYLLVQVVYVLTASPWIKDHLKEENGFFVLPSLSHTIHGRHERFVDAARKYHSLQRALWYLARVPGVRSIAACNTLAWSNTRVESDIDLFIITRPRRVWITRLLCVLPFALLGRRPRPGAVDPFCFSFFVSETYLDFAALRLHKHDVYFAQWVRSCVPLCGQRVFDRFVASNAWVSGLFPLSFGARTAAARRVNLRVTWSLPFFFERVACFLQRRLLPVALRERVNQDSCVVLRDEVLKFHANDRREEFFRRFQELCSNV